VRLAPSAFRFLRPPARLLPLRPQLSFNHHIHQHHPPSTTWQHHQSRQSQTAPSPLISNRLTSRGSQPTSHCQRPRRLTARLVATTKHRDHNHHFLPPHLRPLIHRHALCLPHIRDSSHSQPQPHSYTHLKNSHHNNTEHTHHVWKARPISRPNHE
jgi:hypothetical protein